MRTFYGLNNFLKSGARHRKFVLTIGVFDGVHRAHQKIVKTLVRKARGKRISSLLVTFDPHPAHVLRSSRDVPLLISFKHRLRILEGLGLDYCIVFRFNGRLAGMTASSFIKGLAGKLRITEIVVGRNFFFGRKKSGSVLDLKKFSKKYGYKVSVEAAYKSSGKTVSSTRIRSLILKGELRRASRLLSRPVAVLGTVTEGHKRGRIIGFPTANINPHHEAIPPSGVYAVRVKLGNATYKGILNIGIRPTFKSDALPEPEPTIEVHIFDFKKPIYGKDLEIIFVKRIRNERKFKDALHLRKQIKEDVKRAKRIPRGLYKRGLI